TFVSILIDNKHATMKGTATVNGISGYTFEVRVEDNGEPGIGVDRFRIQIAGPTSYDSNAFAANGGLLTAGNIQTHKDPIDDPQSFVRQQYLDFLHREPDVPRLTFWTTTLAPAPRMFRASSRSVSTFRQHSSFPSNSSRQVIWSTKPT